MDQITVFMQVGGRVSVIERQSLEFKSCPLHANIDLPPWLRKYIMAVCGELLDTVGWSAGSCRVLDAANHILFYPVVCSCESKARLQEFRCASLADVSRRRS